MDSFFSSKHIARQKNPVEPKDVVKNWLRSKTPWSIWDFENSWTTLISKGANSTPFWKKRVQMLLRRHVRFYCINWDGSCCDGLLCADVCLGECEILNGMMTWWHDDMTARRRGGIMRASCGPPRSNETNHVPFSKRHIYLIYNDLAWHSHHGFETFLSHFWFLFAYKRYGIWTIGIWTIRDGSCCDGLFCVAAMRILHWTRITHRVHSRFLSFVSVFGNEQAKCHWLLNVFWARTVWGFECKPHKKPFLWLRGACSNHDLPYLKYFDIHRDSRVREGDDAGRVSPFATSIGDDCRANKG